MVAVVAIVLGVAVDVAGGESVHNMSVLRVRVVVVHVAPRVEAAAVYTVLTGVVVVWRCSF